MDLEFPSFASSRPRHAVGKAQNFKLSSAAAGRCRYELVSTASIMPTIPLRRRLLDELDDIEHDTKRVRLQREIDKLTEDLLDTEFDHVLSDNDNDNDSISSLSSLSSLSDDNSEGYDESLSDLEDQIYENFEQEITALRHEILTTRVLEPGARVPKSSQLHLLDDFSENNVRLFRKKLRVDPQTFHALVERIEEHPIFYNNSNIAQAPPKVQLAIFLNRVGHYGNSASPEDIAQWAGGSAGWIDKCTNRVMVAILSLHDEAIHLPTAEEKEDAKAWVEGESCEEWRDGFLLVDGTKFPVFQRPGLHGDAWYDKNKDYSLDCQVCCHIDFSASCLYLLIASWSCFPTPSCL